MRAFTITLAALGLALTVLGAAVSPDSVHLTPTTDHKPSSIHIALIVQTSRPATACELALDMKPAGMVWLIPGACRNFWDDPRIATGRIGMWGDTDGYKNCLHCTFWADHDCKGPVRHDSSFDQQHFTADFRKVGLARSYHCKNSGDRPKRT